MSPQRKPINRMSRAELVAALEALNPYANYECQTVKQLRRTLGRYRRVWGPPSA